MDYPEEIGNKLDGLICVCIDYKASLYINGIELKLD